MALGPTLDLRQTQSLVMTQQLQQAIRLLALSSLEVEAVVAEELAKNPLLEEERDDRAETREDPVEGDGFDDPEPTGADAFDAEGSALDYDAGAAARETDSLPDLPMSEAGEAFDFDRLEARPHSLKEHLLDQLAGLSGTHGALAEAIVHSLAETGYLERPLGDLAESLGVTEPEIEAALATVQDLDPPGIGARSLRECLLLQAKAADRYDPAMARLIDNLDLLAKGRMKDLQRICRVDEEDLADMVRELRAFDPKPGCRFSSTPATEIVPDVLVRAGEEGWEVELNPEALPRVLVNRAYHAELKASASDKAAKTWLADHLQSANWLVRALDQRAQTILKTAIEIVRVQEGFFKEGVSALKPLTLAAVADKIDVHESTVSRVTSNKYLFCERGLYELKYFFGSGVGAEGSEEGASALAVKAAIKKLIDEEDKVLSDDALVKALRDQGFDLARRTVAKYREAMGIGSSIQRRRQRKMEGR
ncbi:RNA polymerase factor sigma-54 [Sphingomicrobium astaxanthinifaciens]|uniref:RNA polymerase factor sigma-54 n=1 Tax=Sphingomicrobium astaxanthinifaciens TaxID=1227949 RepID=UPI001FCC412E|nr:RNA polymerase factor sigma-54 [Sphingomicrobium astaxanthinifaciens]MCJ7421115.1 RNA polymerase factor sigma-54 [Sphingomicrobium astaxanthinifaciens]